MTGLIEDGADLPITDVMAAEWPSLDVIGHIEGNV